MSSVLADPQYQYFLSIFRWMGTYSLSIGIIFFIVALFRHRYIKSIFLAILIVAPLVYLQSIIPFNPRWWWNDHIVYTFGFLHPDAAPYNNDIGFSTITTLIRNITSNYEIYFAVLGAIYCSCYIWLCKRITNGKATTSFFVTIVATPFFLSYLDNTLRAGLAVSLLLLASTYIYHNRKTAITLALTAASFHLSVLLPVVALGISYFYPKPKLYFIIWLIFLGISWIVGNSFNEYVSGLIGEERVSSYTLQETEGAAQFYKVGFRWDFIAYSLIPMIIGWWYIVKQNFKDKYYNNILSTYLIANAFWLIVIRAPFSDRFAYLSWCMMPILFFYPVFANNTTVANPKKCYLFLFGFTLVLKLYL